ncbi:MAG TPA: hypothetical protein PLV68_02250, partial [Ilumatobacteraceae bacterium]|nr:hypothetical protein [Ilumatobacteraceae bacterium]
MHLSAVPLTSRARIAAALVGVSVACLSLGACAIDTTVEAAEPRFSGPVPIAPVVAGVAVSPEVVEAVSVAEASAAEVATPEV